MHPSRFALPACTACMLLLAFSLLSFSLPAQPVAATTITVQPLADSGGSVTLRYAIGAAVPGDTIVFQPGLTGTISLTSTVTPSKNVTIQGRGRHRSRSTAVVRRVACAITACGSLS